MKKLKKLLAIFVAACVLASAFCIQGAAASNDRDYTIGNAYESVDWDAWGAYKAQLHCHTTASDGANSITEMVEAHYAADYDILCITDHMTVGVEWDKAPELVSLMRLIKNDRTGFGEVYPLTSERRQEIINGVGRDGRGMLEVTQGNELNGAVPSNSHINGFFCDYGQGLIGIDGDYETPAHAVGLKGGITFLDHVGNYTRAYEDKDISRSDKYVDKFSNLFLDEPSCVGMGINSAEDYQTMYDRILYDEILQKTIPHGEVPWSYSFSDAHSNSIEQIDRAFTIHMLPENTVPELRKSMENGNFFSICRYARAEMGEDFVGEGEVPAVTRITVDDDADTITIEGENYDEIVWVADSKEIATGETIDLDDFSKLQISCYVRAYLKGPGGLCYVQPFTVEVEGEEYKQPTINPVYTYTEFLRDIIDLLERVFGEDSLVRGVWDVLRSDWGESEPK